MAKKYIVNLSDEERAGLEQILSRSRISSLKSQRIRILLRADDGLLDEEIADELGVGHATVERIRQRCVMAGIEAALERKPQVRPSRLPKLDGAAEARLIQLACSAAPEGRARWTLQLLADKLVELRIVDSVSDTTVQRRLEKKRAEALAGGEILHPPGEKRGLRLRNGGRPRDLPSAV